MGNNTPTGLVPGKGDQNWVNKISEDKISEIETNVQKRLQEISQVILAKEKKSENLIKRPILIALEWIVNLFNKDIKNEINYYTDDTCTGCGLCDRVCPSGKIKMEKGQPVWQSDERCYYCYACFNYCPTQSILVRNKYSKKEGRYSHPEIQAEDIAGQK